MDIEAKMAADLEDELEDLEEEDSALVEQARFQQGEEQKQQLFLHAANVIQRAFRTYKFRSRLADKAAGQSLSPGSGGNVYTVVKIQHYMDNTKCRICDVPYLAHQEVGKMCNNFSIGCNLLCTMY